MQKNKRSCRAAKRFQTNAWVKTRLLASSGKVDMYVLQKLMTHKSPNMTQRYAHLRDEALKSGASQIDDIFQNFEIQNQNIVNIKQQA